MSAGVADWSPQQVSRWVAGLGGAAARYSDLFASKGLDGSRLLALCCDDLDRLGVLPIGHQELLLEAVDLLRNYHYEVERENLQQLAMRLSVAATSLHSELRTHQDGSKLETQTLADVARVIAAVKPLVCWLDRSPFTEAGPLAERKSALLKLSLEAATCAQRDRFAEHPTRAISCAASTLASLADYIVQEVQEPMVLQPASIVTASWKQGTKPLGLCVLPSFCGHHQVADMRFGSPAHASGHLEEGDEIVQVGDQIVVGWAGVSVLEACARCSADRGGELSVRVRRRACVRAARTTPQLRPARAHRHHAHHAHQHRYPWEYTYLYEFTRELGMLRADQQRSAALRASPTPGGGDVPATGDHSSDESEALSPPASPTHLAPDTRMYPPPPRSLVQRRNSVSGGSPPASRHNISIQQFWQELRNQKSFKHTGSAQMSNDKEDVSNNLYRRDKSVSYSTGLEISPRPKTCLGVGVNQPSTNSKKNNGDESEHDLSHSPGKTRGKLDKSHSTPAYDFGNSSNDEPGSLITQIIPESPSTPTESPTILVHSAEKADQILGFKKYSSQIGEAILQQQHKHKLNDEKTKFSFIERIEAKETIKDNDKVLETINIAMLERQNRDEKKIVTKQSSFKLQTTFSENGQTTTTKTFSISEHVRNIQDEIVQAINDQRVANTRQIKIKEISDVPPQPPPRPFFTQKPVPKESLQPMKDSRIKDYPPLKPVKELEIVEQKEYTPLKPLKHGDNLQISVPIKHLTKHDIQVIPNEKRELMPLNCDSTLNLSQMDITKSLIKSSNLNVMSNPDLVSSMNSSMTESTSLQKLDLPFSMSATRSNTLSPSTSVVRNIFPSKSKSLKKKNSLLVKRRKISVWELSGVVWRSGVYQRVRRRATCWARRLLVLRDDALLAYKDAASTKADCLIFLNGFTVAAASEVKSKPFAFKVYHTGTAFYFAADTAEEQAAWIQHIGRATLNDSYDSHSTKGDESRNFSETDYSDADHSDKEGTEKKDKERDREKEKEKDKSKFGSLKKLTHRMNRSESQENVSHSSTSLDRKYLRFFSRNKHKDDGKSSKIKQPAAPVPTEHYRSYRRVNPTQYSHTEQTHTPHNVAKIKKIDPIQSKDEEAEKALKKIPKPINYIHASNPNLLDFEKSDFVTKPSLQVPLAKPKVKKPDNLVGFITLEEFMLKEQEQERQQAYSNRVQLGIEKDKKDDIANSKKAAKELQKQWERIVPDVIYGELPTYTEDQLPIPVLEQIQSRCLPKTPERQKKSETLDKSYADGKPVSVKGKDGYEKIVYTLEKTPLKDPDSEPPKILPRKPIISEKPSPDVSRKCSLTTAKDLGYEVIYDEKSPTSDAGRCPGTAKIVKDLDYETIYGPDRIIERRKSDDVPPKIMPKSKQVLNRQNSLNRNSGVDTAPVFVQGECPEKFWLNSLRRNDKVHNKKVDDRSKPLKSATQYTPMALPLNSGASLATAPHLQISLDTKDIPSPSRAGISRLRQIFGGTIAAGGTTRTRTTPHQERQPDVEDNDDWCIRLASPEASQYPHLQLPPTFQPETYSLTDRGQGFLKKSDDKN